MVMLIFTAHRQLIRGSNASGLTSEKNGLCGALIISRICVKEVSSIQIMSLKESAFESAFRMLLRTTLNF